MTNLKPMVRTLLGALLLAIGAGVGAAFLFLFLTIVRGV